MWALLPDEQNNVDVYKKANPGVVNITTATLTQDFFYDIVPQKGVGSGVIVRADGYIVTNDHVAGNAQKVEVTLFDQTKLKARVVGTDPDSDIAVLKVDPKDKKLTALEYANPDTISVGQKVLAIGNPFTLGGSLSVGIISSLGRGIRATTGRNIKDVIQTDAAINPGNSGGPLLDSSGKIVGINAQIFSRSGGSEGIGFAIPVKTVQKIAEQLITHGRVLRPYLGLRGVGFHQNLFETLNIPLERGLMVTGGVKTGPAAQAGIRPATKEYLYGFQRIPFGGDIIYQVDDVPVSGIQDLLDYIGDKKAGEKVTVHYLRGNLKRSATLTLQIPSQSADGTL